MAINYGTMSAPGASLGLGTNLADELTNLSEEERKKKQKQMAAERFMPNASSAPGRALAAMGGLGGGVLGTLSSAYGRI